LSNRVRVKPEECNLDTDNLVIIWYHNYSGGKFMANCLGLNDNALFQDKQLAEAQIAGEFSVEDKLDYLLGQIQLNRKGIVWNDLNLTDKSFFGFEKRDYIDPWRGISFHSYVKDVTESDYKFFIASHFMPEVLEIVKIWKNAKIILFTDVEEFVTKRTQDDPFLRTYLKALDSHPAELEEMSKLDNIIYKFDVRKYESETETLDAVKELYEILDLPGYNREYLAKYWNHWANKIDEIAN
jgi:hypothetical protein|tara:strand:+ start:1295 stop:2014 length:720 start_codon:yes stop_codon:yes gene_type:complete